MAAASALLASAGCAVPQPRGEGLSKRIIEATSGRAYYLYLPKGYANANEAERKSQRWPVVVSFHGMKPYDTAPAQNREWQQEADRYGFIVVAPVLNAFAFIFGEFPLNRVNSAFKSDEEAILAILSDVFETTDADPNNVLATSWSSGGYMAHYMLNRHPDRFTCLAVRQSNFSLEVLDPAMTSQSLYHPVLIVTTENDFAICKKESNEAIKWYEQHGYKTFAWINLKNYGHERTPDVAADFFARVAGVRPNYPPRVLVRRQAIDGNPRGLALLAGKLGEPERPPRAARPEATPGPPPAVVARTPRRPVMQAGQTNAEPAAAQTVAEQAASKTTPPRRTEQARAAQQSPPVGIRVSSAIGFEPLLLAYTADCPTDWHRTADFLWSLNGEKIGHGINGQRTLTKPGDYLLELLIVTNSGQEFRSNRRIRVLEDIQTSAVHPATPGR